MNTKETSIQMISTFNTQITDLQPKILINFSQILFNLVINQMKILSIAATIAMAVFTNSLRFYNHPQHQEGLFDFANIQVDPPQALNEGAAPVDLLDSLKQKKDKAVLKLEEAKGKANKVLAEKFGIDEALLGNDEDSKVSEQESNQEEAESEQDSQVSEQESNQEEAKSEQDSQASQQEENQEDAQSEQDSNQEEAQSEQDSQASEQEQKQEEAQSEQDSNQEEAQSEKDSQASQQEQNQQEAKSEQQSEQQDKQDGQDEQDEQEDGIQTIDVVNIQDI